MSTSDQGHTTGRSLASAEWLQSPALLRVLSLLNADGGSARIVGGSVRNALIGMAISDIDIATPLLPSEVIERATRAGLGVYPTGLEHGTVTIVSEGHPFEVTTLRRDVETDGRHAIVAFTSDWREDAARRDFTMNALYADAAGNVFDYFGGLQDLAQRHVRFIGDASQRIREDYLRILRFFRFNAQFAEGPPDAVGLAACVALKDGLLQLSSERIGMEFMKLLDAPRAAEIVAIMADCSILLRVLGRETYPDRLTKYIDIEKTCGLPADPLSRLAALALDSSAGASHLAAHLRLSNAQADVLSAASRRNDAYDPSTPDRAARRWLYQIGGTNFRRGALVSWASSAAPPSDAARKDRAFLPDRWTPPTMPIHGSDVLALGIKQGPDVGVILRAFETWWMEEDFPTDTALHKTVLQALTSKSLPKP